MELTDPLEDVDEATKLARKNMWKDFGRETKAGKMLYNLYKSHEKPKIDYPKPKQKTKEQLQEEKLKQLKPPPPQSVKIQYPQPAQRQREFHMIDVVPRKKNKEVILDEMQKDLRQYQLPAYRPINREKMKEELRVKFKNARGALPKGAEMPVVKLDQQDQKAIQARMKERMDRMVKKETKKEQEQTRKTRRQQLNELFDEVCKEIEERQEYLDEVQRYGDSELNERVKRQIIERVAQLQRITELRAKEKQNQA